MCVCVCVYVYTPHLLLSICLSADIYNFFHVLGTVNTAAVNIQVHLSFQSMVFSVLCSEMERLSWHKCHCVQRPSCRGGAWIFQSRWKLSLAWQIRVRPFRVHPTVLTTFSKYSKDPSVPGPILVTYSALAPHQINATFYYIQDTINCQSNL